MKIKSPITSAKKMIANSQTLAMGVILASRMTAA
jgi:hypothetical protein